MPNLRADVESERSISSSVVGLREMIDRMREEMEMIRMHDLEQFACQLKSIEKKNETLSRNTEELIKYENEYSEFTRKKFEAFQEDYNVGRRPPRPFTMGEPIPPVFLSVSPQPLADKLPVPALLHCGFCNAEFSGDVREHKRICWPVNARRISTTPPSKPLDPKHMCSAEARICGDCFGCRHDLHNYLRGFLKL